MLICIWQHVALCSQCSFSDLSYYIQLEAVNEAREANLNEITEVQQGLQDTKDTITSLKKQLNDIHEHDAVLKYVHSCHCIA